MSITMINHYQSPLITTGWWYTYPSEKYEFVSWDDEIPNSYGKKKKSKPPTSDDIINNH